MHKAILPDSTVVVASEGDIDAPLFEEEKAVVNQAVDKRRREFTTARACARAALAQLGVSPQAIPSGDRGAPQWPAGIVGSITHCDGYRACALARATDFACIGIDAEPNEPLPEGLLGDIALPQEHDSLRALMHDSPKIRWDRLLFSMKEAVYKAWFPLAEKWLGFEDAVITIDQQLQAFSARLLVSGPVIGGHELPGFSGKWLFRDGLLFTAIALPVASRASRQRAELLQGVG